MEIFPGILRKFKDFSRKENSSKISRTSRRHMHQVPIEVAQFSIIRNTGIRFIDTLKELHTVKNGSKSSDGFLLVCQKFWFLILC